MMMNIVVVDFVVVSLILVRLRRRGCKWEEATFLHSSSSLMKMLNVVHYFDVAVVDVGLWM